MLAEKIDRWGPEILEQGIEQGIERHRVLVHRLAELRFGRAAAARLWAVLLGATDEHRLAEAGEWTVDCATTADLLGPREPRGLVTPCSGSPIGAAEKTDRPASRDRVPGAVAWSLE